MYFVCIFLQFHFLYSFMCKQETKINIHMKKKICSVQSDSYFLFITVLVDFYI